MRWRCRAGGTKRAVDRLRQGRASGASWSACRPAPFRSATRRSERRCLLALLHVRSAFSPGPAPRAGNIDTRPNASPRGRCPASARAGCRAAAHERVKAAAQAEWEAAPPSVRVALPIQHVPAERSVAGQVTRDGCAEAAGERRAERFAPCGLCSKGRPYGVLARASRGGVHRPWSPRLRCGPRSLPALRARSSFPSAAA